MLRGTSGKFCLELFMSKSQRNVVKGKGCEKNEKCLPNSYRYWLKLHIFLISMHTSTLHFPTFSIELLHDCAYASNYYLLSGPKRRKDFKNENKSLSQVLPLQKKHRPHEASWKVTIKAKSKQGLLENAIAQYPELPAAVSSLGYWLHNLTQPCRNFLVNKTFRKFCGKKKKKKKALVLISFLKTESLHKNSD